jgi:hypothetical protein
MNAVTLEGMIDVPVGTKFLRQPPCSPKVTEQNLTPAAVSTSEGIDANNNVRVTDI